jgi:hypothetical protein
MNKLTKKQIDFLIDPANKEIIDWEFFLSISAFDTLNLKVIEYIASNNIYKEKNHLEIFWKLISYRCTSLTIDFIKKYQDEIVFLIMQLEPDTFMSSVYGLFGNLRKYILNGKRKFVEQVIVEFYDIFESIMQKHQKIKLIPMSVNSILIILYKVHVTEKISPELALFLKMKE